MCCLRPLLSIIPIIFLTSSFFGQKPLLIELPAADTCSLPEDLRLSEVFIACRENIGYASGINGTSVIFLTDMKGQLKRSFSSCADRTGPPIAIKINRLNLREFHGGELHTVHVNLDILEERTDGWHLLYNVGSQKEARSIKHLASTILSAFEECLVTYTNERNEDLTTDIPLREEELTQQTDPDHINNPILEGDLPVGLFATFQDMREKRAFVPPLNGAFHIKAVKADLRNSVWGYSDGLKIFVRIGNKFIPLERGAHVLRGRIKEKQGDQGIGPAIAIGVMFGLAGVLVIQAAEKPSEYEVNVELLAGEFDRTDQTFDDRTVFHAIQYSHHSDSTEPIFVLHKGDTLTSLVSEQFCLIRCRPDLKDLEIEIATRNGSIPMILPLDKVQPKAHLVDVEEGLPVKKPVPLEMNGKLLERLRIEHKQPLSREL